VTKPERNRPWVSVTLAPETVETLDTLSSFYGSRSAAIDAGTARLAAWHRVRSVTDMTERVLDRIREYLGQDDLTMREAAMVRAIVETLVDMEPKETPR
jgi:hypothetical protein